MKKKKNKMRNPKNKNNDHVDKQNAFIDDAKVTYEDGRVASVSRDLSEPSNSNQQPENDTTSIQDDQSKSVEDLKCTSGKTNDGNSNSTSKRAKKKKKKKLKKQQNSSSADKFVDDDIDAFLEEQRAQAQAERLRLIEKRFDSYIEKLFQPNDCCANDSELLDFRKALCCLRKLQLVNSGQNDPQFFKDLQDGFPLSVLTKIFFEYLITSIDNNTTTKHH